LLKVRLTVESVKMEAFLYAHQPPRKTFIAIHVMRKACKSENQRVIYVAPTKALCDEVQTRMKADFPNEIGTFSSLYMEYFQGRWEPIYSDIL